MLSIAKRMHKVFEVNVCGTKMYFLAGLILSQIVILVIIYIYVKIYLNY